MAQRYRVEAKQRLRGDEVYVVLDDGDHGRPVARFDDREEAERHVAKLHAGPFDWDEQEAWKDGDDDDAWDEF